MVEKELGLAVESPTVKIPEALTMSASYIVGSIFPLIAYFFLPIQVALPVSFALTLLALVIVGYRKGKLADLNLTRSILEVVLVGALSAAGGTFWAMSFRISWDIDAAGPAPWPGSSEL